MPQDLQLDGDLEVVRSRFEGAVRPRPDARFMLAIADVHRLITGQTAGVADAEWRNGTWAMSYRGTETGGVSALPDFAELLDHLRVWAVRLSGQGAPQKTAGMAERNSATKETKGFFAPDLIVECARLNRLWAEGQHDAAVLQQAAPLLVNLALQTTDTAQVGDALAARALAVLATAQALGPDPLRREEVLLAGIMGYNRHAGEAAATLEADDPVRLYAVGGDARLAAIVGSPHTDARSRFLLLSRQVAREASGEWWESSHRWFGDTPQARLVVAATGLPLRDFGMGENLGYPVIEMILHALDRGLPAGPPDEPPSPPLAARLRDLALSLGIWSRPGLASRLERGLGAIKIDDAGPFLDREVVEAFNRALFWSAVQAIGWFNLEQLSSVEGTQQFAAELTGGKREAASELALWFAHLADAKAGRAERATLQRDLNEMATVGVIPLLETLDQLQAMSEYGAGDVRRAARQLAMRMDTRPLHRRHVAEVARRFLLDPVATAALLGSYLRTAGPEPLQAAIWIAGYTGDVPQLRQLLREAELSGLQSVVVLTHLEHLGGMETVQLEREYVRLSKTRPADWYVCEGHAKFLLAHGRRADAERHLSEWIASNRPAGGFPFVCACIALADLLLEDGRYQEGLEVITPAAESWKLDALRAKALLLDAVGQRRDALELARAVMDRYPDSNKSLVLLARLLWRHGEHDEAAELIGHHPYPLNAGHWRFDIGPAFAAEFAARPEQAVTAVKALRRIQTPPEYLLPLATEANKRGAPQVAFAIVADMRIPGITDLSPATAGYTYLRQFRGDQAALEWLMPRVPAEEPNALCVFAYYEKAYELLWKAFPEQPSGNGWEWVWVMRAAALLKLGNAGDPRWRAVLHHYNVGGEGFANVVGRHLVGRASQAEVLSAADSPRPRCDAAYYVGLKAQVDGRLEEASGWYRLAVELGDPNWWEARWAFAQLDLWRSAEKSLGLIASEEVGRSSGRHAPTKR